MIFGNRTIGLVGIRIHFNDLMMCQLGRTGVNFLTKKKEQRKIVFLIGGKWEISFHLEYWDKFKCNNNHPMVVA